MNKSYLIDALNPPSPKATEVVHEPSHFQGTLELRGQQMGRNHQYQRFSADSNSQFARRYKFRNSL